jgi:hypothetical protein
VVALGKQLKYTFADEAGFYLVIKIKQLALH